MQPRVTKPEKGNKYYINTKDGGYNSAKGNPNRKNKELTSLPNCFSGDTKFITKSGLKRLKDCVGEVVFVLTEDGEWREAEVKHFGKARLTRIMFPFGKTVYATQNHRWIVDKDVRTKDGRGYVRAIRATNELSTSTYNKIPIVCRSRTENITYSEDGVRHGFIFGDGSYYNGGNYTRASLCGDKKGFMYRFFSDGKSCENANGAVECYPYPKEYKSMPSLEESDEYLMGFLMGLMAAYGCAGRTGRYIISTASAEVAEYIVDLLARLRIRTNGARANTRTRTIKGRVYENHTMYHISLFNQCINPEMVINPKHRSVIEKSGGRPNRYVFPKEIEETQIEEDVYCVVEPITHSFTLDGNILTGNCVSIYGWFNEIGEQGMKYLKIPYYPYAVIEAAKRQGLEITKAPTEGGIMVWTGGATGEGHVEGCAIVHDENTITSVGSEYYGRDWAVFKRKNTDGHWRSGCKWMNKSYIYQGCIKNPFMEEEMSYEQFKAYMDQYEKEKASEKADDWSKEAINMAIAQGYMVGYPDGFHAQSNIRREEVAQVSANLLAVVKDYVAMKIGELEAAIKEYVSLKMGELDKE